jgi:hypothetical protein
MDIPRWRVTKVSSCCLSVCLTFSCCICWVRFCEDGKGGGILININEQEFERSRALVT